MRFKKTIELSTREKDTLFESGQIVREICDNFSDCSDCPLVNICHKIKDCTALAEFFEEVYLIFKD